jgi:Flp pilus assembly protein TadD
MGRLDQAGEHFSEAARLKPDSSGAFTDLGLVRYLQGRTEEAIAAYNQALQIKPDSPETRYNLGRALADQGKFEEAIGEYRRSLQIRPDDARTHSSLGALLATHGQLDEAVTQYRRALQLKPDLPEGLVDLAWILATTDRPDLRAPDEAIRLAERVADLTRHQDATVLYTLAVAYAAAGRPEQAIMAAQAALDLASSAGRDELADRIRKRLELYKQQPR